MTAPSGATRGVTRGGGEDAGAVVGDDVAMVTVGGKGDPAQLVECEDLGSGDVAGASQRDALVEWDTDRALPVAGHDNRIGVTPHVPVIPRPSRV
jgi:hypothetical protein